MCNTIDDDDVADVSYSLFAVVVHLGSRPDHGNHILFFDFFPFGVMAITFIQIPLNL